VGFISLVIKIWLFITGLYATEFLVVYNNVIKIKEDEKMYFFVLLNN